MSLFAQRFAEPRAAEPALPGRYDRTAGLRVDEAGQPMALTATVMAGTLTRAMRDTDESLLALGPATRADRDRPSLTDATLVRSTVTLSGPDRD